MSAYSTVDKWFEREKSKECFKIKYAWTEVKFNLRNVLRKKQKIFIVKHQDQEIYPGKPHYV